MSGLKEGNNGYESTLQIFKATGYAICVDGGYMKRKWPSTTWLPNPRLSEREHTPMVICTPPTTSAIRRKVQGVLKWINRSILMRMMQYFKKEN